MNEISPLPDPKQRFETSLSFGTGTILCVDDEETTLFLLRRILEGAGYGVRSLSSGHLVADTARTLNPDLILLDVMMPGRNGFEVFQDLQQSPVTRHTPVIFLTALDDRERKVQGLRMGGMDYITKPFETEEVLARIRNLLRLRTAMRILEKNQEDRLKALKKGQAPFLTDPQVLQAAHCEVWYRPASGVSGGDQYDIVPLGEGLFAYFLADFSGHGLETSYHSTVMKALFREHVLLNDDPRQTFQRLNSILRSYMEPDQFITAVLMVVNRFTCKVTLACAGHHAVLVSIPGGNVRRIKPEGDPLGAWPEPYFEVYQASFPRGCRFWLCTDGLLEDFDRNQSGSQGLGRLESLVEELSPDLSLKASIESVVQTLVPQVTARDDQVLMVVDL